MTDSKIVYPEVYIDKYLEAYELGKGFHWIAQELGIGYRRAISRAGYFRSYGLELPYLRNNGHNLNDDSRAALNVRIRERLAKIKNQ